MLYTSSHPYTIRAYIIPSIQPDAITARTSDLDQGFPKYFPPQGAQPAGEMVPARVLCLPHRRGHGLPGGRNILWKQSKISKTDLILSAFSWSISESVILLIQ